MGWLSRRLSAITPLRWVALKRSSVQAVEIVFLLVEPTFTVDGVYAAERGGRMRVDVFAEG